MVELIVVCAIVAVLTAIVTSVFLAARGSARATSCIANLSNIDKAYKLYQVDSDGRYPPYAWLAVHGMQPRRAEFISAMDSYGIKEIVWCPSDSHKKTSFSGEWHDFLDSSYVLTDINLAILSKPEPGNHINLSSDMVGNPAQVVQSLDQTWLDDDRKAGTRERYSAHGKKANVVYVDGHSKALPVGSP